MRRPTRTSWGSPAAATAAQLERLVRSYRRAQRKEDEIRSANERHDRRYLSWYWDDDGMLVVHGRLDPEDGALLLGLLAGDESGSAEPSGAAIAPKAWCTSTPTCWSMAALAGASSRTARPSRPRPRAA